MRAPGAPSVSQPKEHFRKIEYQYGIYSNMHRGIIPHNEHIKENNVDKLSGMDFVFLCIDNGKIKEPIVSFLDEKGISSIDVGMGVHTVEGQLIGIVRTTTSTKKKRDHVKDKCRISFSDDQEDEYSTNIQIAELNV